MEWFLWTLAVAVLGLAAVAGTGRFGGMPDAVIDVPGSPLREGELTGEDLRDVRFQTTWQGYSAAQVDELLDRLAAQLDAVATAVVPQEDDDAHDG